MLKFSLQSFLSFARWPHLFALVSASLILEGLYYVGRPFTFELIFDEITGPQRFLELFEAVGLLGALLVCMALGITGQEYAASRLCVRSMNDLRARMFHKMQTAPPGFFETEGSPEIATLFGTDVRTVETALLRGILPLILHGSVAILCVALLFWIEWRLALATFVALPIAFVIPKAFAGRAKRSEHAYAQTSSSLVSMVQESVLTHTVVRLFDLVTSRRRKFGERLQGIEETAPDATFFTGMVGRSAVVGTSLAQLVVIGVGAYLVVDDAITAGQLVAFVALLSRVSDGVSAVTTALPLVIPAQGARERIDAFLATPLPALEDADAQPVERLSGAIRFEEVGYRHDGAAPLFEHLSLEIRPRQRVAFVGTSGSGKSTIIGLLLRMYRCQEGRIVLDDREIGKVAETSLRANTSTVPQSAQMFDATIGENIVCGRPGATESEMISAARAAAVHESILAKPDGYDTRISTGSANLSGGERQRVAIARALIRDTPVLVLDEATSALDPATEEMVNRSITENVRDRTVISVTHRLGAVADFDRIFVLEQGRLIESGTHQELLAHRGRYHELWEKQHGFNVESKAGEANVTAERLQLVPFLSACRPETLAELARYFLLLRYSEETVVFREGDVGDWFYIVAHGSLQVRRQQANGDDVVVGNLTRGDFFGEMALVNDAPRAATIVSTSASRCLALPRQHFLALMHSEETVRQNIESAIARIREFNAGSNLA